MSTQHYESESRGRDLPAEDYKQRRRIQEIRDLVKHIREQRRRAEDFYREGQIGENTRRRMYRMAVHELINDSRYTMQETDKTVEVELAEDDIEEWSCWDYFWLSAHLGTVQIPGREDYEFHGLQSLKDFPDPLEVEIRHERSDLVEGRTVSFEYVQVQVPMHVTENALVELLDFWGMHGLDITTGDDVETWSFNEVPDEDPEDAAHL